MWQAAFGTDESTIVEPPVAEGRVREVETEQESRPVGRLPPTAPVETLRRRLRELGGAIYGTKQQLWKRLERCEKKHLEEQKHQQCPLRSLAWQSGDKIQQQSLHCRAV